MQEKVTNKKHFDSERNISAREKVEVANMIAIQYDGAKGLFKERLNKLFADQKCTVVAFSEKAGITRQAMTSYLNGENVPDMKRLFQICKACNVSADYLLGLSATPNPDPDAQSACKYTGLSDSAIQKIRSYTGGLDNPLPGKYASEFEYIIQHPSFFHLLYSLKEAMTLTDKYLGEYGISISDLAKAVIDATKTKRPHISFDSDNQAMLTLPDDQGPDSSAKRISIKEILKARDEIDKIDLCYFRAEKAFQQIINDKKAETEEKDGADNGEH